MEKQKPREIVGFFLLGISLLLLGKMVALCFSADIWYDEVFSVKMIFGSYGDILRFTAKDVHPPFYYWYLKGFVWAGSLLLGGWTKERAVILAKLASVLPMTGIWLLAAVKVRKRFGLFVAGLFSFCVCTMPQLTAYGMEIRMYSLALFLVTLAFFFAYDICVTKQSRAFLGLFLCGICIAYTQYFSCLGIILLYSAVGWFVRRDKNKLKKWGLCVGLSVLAYLPWIGILIRQFTQVKGSYWIEPLTWKSLAGCIKYIYLPSGGYPRLNYILAAVFILTTLLLAGLFLKKKIREGAVLEHEGIALVFSWGMLGGVILLGVGISILISPIFVYRYMIPFLGSFWFVFALLTHRCDRKSLWLFACILTVFIGYINVKGVFWEERNKQEHMEDTLLGLEQIGQEDILIFNFNHVQAVVGYYQENESYLLYQEPEALMHQLYSNFKMLEDETQIENLFSEKKNGQVWFLGSFNSREEIVEKWRSMGFSVTEEGSFLLERYWFNLYHIEK
ncbi:MAG: hypothetical protein ACI4DN_03050 [Lachnospiraceae bacterium]